MANRSASASASSPPTSSACLVSRPLIGRAITPEEDVPNGPQVAVLGYPLWQSRYGGDPNVIGKTLMINEVPVKSLA